MARILIATTPATRHVNPMAVLVPELINRGHTMWWSRVKHLKAKWSSWESAINLIFNQGNLFY
ncbi:hypothetical protein [Moorena sp. SIO3H5]|uniref:hypothetical protein n=1 Tax=Moorena sp. SIO3H5 TaxID=2607834 RepID=UPI0013BE5E18|nr:hypothetical protein [Moorena sp. SIO3H5]NEO73740.1 hypothetical protein [Moorena sp. SIO3H5]